jgi:hypothetical protein
LAGLLAFLFVYYRSFSSARKGRPFGVSVIKIRIFAILFLALAVLNSACIKHVTVADNLPVNSPLPVDELVNRINSFRDVKTFGAQGTIVVRNYFTGKDNKADEFPGANFVIRLKQPESIRLIVKAPFIGKQVAEMSSNGDRFQLAIFYPDDKRQFVYGTNVNEITRMSKVESKDPTLVKAGGLLNMRPQHYTDAFLIKPIGGVFEVFREEVLQEEADTRPGRKNKRVTKSYYVLYVIERDKTGENKTLAELRRKFWFDRNQSGTPLARQQTFEADGKLASDISYNKWVGVPNADKFWPEEIIVDRRNDGYQIKLILERDSVEINLELPENIFTLENIEKLREVNLDEPRKAEPETKKR